MKTNEFLKRDWSILIILLIPFIMILLFWDKYPAQIPLHWSFSGEIDNFGSKIPALFYIPCGNILLYLLFLAIPKIDPRWDNFKLFKKAYQVIKFSVVLLMSFLFFIITLYSFGYKIDIMYAVIIPITILFAILGNFMGNIRQNYFVGIRLPWTLSNEQVWTITHRFAGKLWVGCSIIMLFLIFLLPSEIIKYVFWVNFGIMILVPSAYSYMVYKKIKSNGERVELEEKAEA